MLYSRNLLNNILSLNHYMYLIDIFIYFSPNDRMFYYVYNFDVNKKYVCVQKYIEKYVGTMNVVV